MIFDRGLVSAQQHQAQGHGAQDAGNEDDHRGGEEVVAVGRGVEDDLQVAVVLVGAAAAGEADGVVLLGAQDRVGQPAGAGVQQRPGLFRQHRFFGVADGGVAHGFVLEQAFQDLHRHVAVEAVDGLGGRIADHRQDALCVVVHGLARLVGVVDDLGTAEDHPDHEGREQYHSQQLEGEAVPGIQFQGRSLFLARANDWA